MGIEHFYNWLKTTYPNAIIPVTSLNIYSGIYIDCNHLLHNCINGSNTLDEFKQALKVTLDILFSNFLAHDNIVIGVDGPAPYAKVILQRKRRSMMGEVSDFDSMHLTPGTQVMYKIDEFINAYLNNLKNIYKIVKPNVEYIGSCIPDEGELKIFTRLKENKNKTNLVVGNDADLIVMATCMTSVNHINILLHHKCGKELFSLDKFIDIFKKDINVNELTESELRLDFSLMSIMQGNDYLPKLNYLNFDNAFNTYKEVVRKYKKSIMTTNITINIEMFINFLIELMVKLPKHYRTFKMDKFNYPEIKNYFEGLLWCLNMYNTGVCSMYDYVYIGKKSPCPINLLMFCIINKNKIIETPLSNVIPLSVDYYTLLIMPKKAKALIPKKYHGLIEGKFKYLYDREMCNECLKYKSKLSEYHIELIKRRKEELDNKDVREKLSKVSIDFNSHKKEKHQITFNCDDIKKIVLFISMRK